MDFLKDRRAIIIGGVGLALGVGLAAVVLIALGQDASDDPPPAAETGLVVQTGHEEVRKLDPAQPLKCFMNGRLAGVMTVADCAKKNGVTTGTLAVGVDQSGGLAASRLPPADVAPPPAPPQEDVAAETAQFGAGPVADTPEPGGQPCWSHDGGTWSRSAADVSLNACVRSLFDGQCVRPGGVAYGRWGDRTLRLVAGRVEMSSEGHTFRTLTQQADGCVIPETE
jgi:hypothetical protein